jgi:hypothetical protein
MYIGTSLEREMLQSTSYIPETEHNKGQNDW